MNFWIKYQWTVVGITGTIVIHLILLLFLNFKTLPEVAVTNEVLMDFSESSETIPEEQPKNLEKTDEYGRPITNVAADVNSETQRSSDMNRNRLNNEVDEMIKDLENEYKNEATRTAEALENLENERKERLTKNNLFDENADDVEAVQGEKGIRASAKWSLSDRKNFDLPAPSYVCRGEGEVHVSIKVNKNGEVTSVNIVEAKTNTNDECLRGKALSYAKRARFNDDYSAASAQKGWIHFSYSKQ